MANRLIDMLWGLLAVLMVYVAGLLRVHYRPFFQQLKRIGNLSRIVQELEEEVALGRNKLHALQSISQTPLYIIDTNGEMTWANQAYIDATGFKDEREAYNLGYLRAVHPADRAEISTQRVLLAQTESSFNGPVRFRKLNTGEEVSYLCVSQTFKNKAGKVVYTIGGLYPIRQALPPPTAT